jgi:hypothetical protein
MNRWFSTLFYLAICLHFGCAPSAIEYSQKGVSSTGGSGSGSGLGGPQAFSFTNQTGVSLGAAITSNAVTLSGFTGLLPANCIGCLAILRNGSIANGVIFSPGDTIAIQLSSSASPNTAATASVTVGSTTSSVWSVTTTLNAPMPFSFSNQTGVITNATITSNSVTLAGTFSGLSASCNVGCIGISRNGGAFSAGPVAGFTNGDSIAIRLTSSSNSTTPVFATVSVGGTTSSSWSVTTTTDPCAGSPTIGTVCIDGTIYAGLTPDGNVPMFASPCDYGQSGVGCATGTAASTKWSYGNSIATGFTGNVTGRSYTASLFALNGNADGPYEAATDCKTLTQNGHSDWYLPALAEINVLYVNRAAIGGFTASFYWTSTEQGGGSGWAEDFSNGLQNTGTKSNLFPIRCVRR